MGLRPVVVALLAVCGAAMASSAQSQLQPPPGGPLTGAAARAKHHPGPPTSFELALIVQSGDEPPQRPGESFTFFSDPSLDAAGRVVFRGDFDGPLSGNQGIYLFEQDGGLVRIVDDSFDFSPPAQSGASSWTGFGPPVIENGGKVHFWGTFSFGDNSQGLYVFQRSVGNVIFDDNPLQPVPGHPGANGFTTFPFSAGVIPFVSDTVHGATQATFFDAGFVQRTGLYVGDVLSGIVRVADETQTPPGQDGAASFSDFDTAMAMNLLGDVAFHAEYSGGIGSHGIYRHERAVGILRRVADGRTDVPGHPGASFTTLDGFLSTNDAGQVAFGGSYAAGPGNDGIYLGDGISPLVVVVDDSGAFPVPDHPGKAFSSFGDPAVDAAGDVVFFGIFGGGAGDRGLFRRTAGGTLERVFDFGDPVPGQPGATFFAMGSVVLNDVGHAAFTARYSGGTGDEGVYFHDGKRLVRVVDESDVSLGVTLTNLHILLFSGGTGGQDGKPRTMNASDDIAFRASLGGGNEVVILATRVD